MHHLIYMSMASWPMTDAELGELLAQAQRGNARRGITGALVYGDGQFMQLMEGEQADLEELYAHFGHDHRHKGLFKLADRAIAERRFSEWSMAFRVVLSAEFEQLAGYVAPARLSQQLSDLGAADSPFLARMRTLRVECGT